MSWQAQYGPPPPQGYSYPNQYQQPYPHPHHQNQHAHHQNSYAASPPQMNYSQYPPHGGHSPYPPQGNPYPPPGAPYGAPPPAGFPSHPQASLPPQHGHSPFPPHQAGYPPPQPPPGPYGAGFSQQSGSARADAEMLRSAMAGAGTNEAQLIRVLAHVPNAMAMAQLRQTYDSMHRRDLIRDLESETSGYFRDALVAIARGPETQDAYLLRKAIDRLGTEESVLNDVLLGRSNQAIHGIQVEYQRIFQRELASDVKGDLSFETQKFFQFVLCGQRLDENTPVYPQQAHNDAETLAHAMAVKGGSTNQTQVSEMLTSRSDGQLRAIAAEFQRVTGKPLEKVIQKNFSGHLKHAYLQLVGRAQDRAKADAESLEETMRGVGTDDRHLVNRLVRVHWNREHMHQVKAAYKHFYRKELVARIRGETSGNYRDLLVAIADQ